MQNNNDNKSSPKNGTKNRYAVLSQEDKILWEAVAKSTRPLRTSTVITVNEDIKTQFKTMLSDSDQANNSKMVLTKRAVAEHYQAKTNKDKQAIAINAIDRKTHRKIAKGKVEIDARIDLHDLTQSEAHILLLRFLQSAQVRGFRHVLIITGKGKSPQSNGILRYIVPHWLATPAFRIYISAIHDAAINHGGDGAIYLKLRKMSD